MLDEFINFANVRLANLIHSLEELEDQMEQLDENSKDFRDLDFEFNYTSGQINATTYLIQHAKELQNA